MGGTDQNVRQLCDSSARHPPVPGYIVIYCSDSAALL